MLRPKSLWYLLLKVPPKHIGLKCLCRRAWIFIGTQCNIRCPFCYYKNRKREFYSIEKIHDQLKIAKLMGMTSVDFSGGEFTIYPDIDTIVNLAFKYVNSVSFVTNGIRLADKKFVKHLSDLGIHEVLISLHGLYKTYKAFGYPYIVDKVIQAIENCKELGWTVRINHTVTFDSLQELDPYLELMIKLKINQLNFIPMNLWADNKIEFNRGKLVRELDMFLDDDFPFKVNVRYVPFCQIKRKDRVVGTLQHVFDKFDWAPLFNRLRFSQDQNTLIHAKDDYDKFVRMSYKEQLKFRTNTWNYNNKCYSCKYVMICDGIQKYAYSQNSYVKPELADGKYITDPLYFRGCKSNL